MDKNNNTLNGVRCTVANCTYHCFDNSCAAKSIEVHEEGGNSTQSCDTLCSTFKNNNIASAQQSASSLDGSFSFENNVNRAGNWTAGEVDGFGTI